MQADGKILAGGGFTSIGGQTRNFIARLDATTGLADSFDPNANGVVLSIAVQADGNILAGGSFTTLSPSGGVPVMRNHIARLNPDGTLDTAFDPNANSTVDSIAVQANGSILAGGGFNGTNSIGGATRNFIARLDATTGAADSFDPNANNTVDSIAVQADGKILAGGFFNGANSIGGQTRNFIARLDATTGLADSFDPNANNAVISIAVQADGKILAGGEFNGANSIGGQPRNYIARLDATTGAADSFDPNANDQVFSIAVQTDGKILAGGQFSNIGGQPRSLFARLSNDTAALQNLAVTQSAITWTLGGSSSQFTRVTFEYSTDNVNYTSLGNGTASGSNWTLTGQSFPIGQNFYIRARGYYRSGYQNGSESITESVRNAFPLVSAVSRLTHGSAGTFDVNLPLTGTPGVECRSSASLGAGNYSVVFTFMDDVTNCGSAGTIGGSVSSGPNPNQCTENLTGVPNAQYTTVTLNNVVGSQNNSGNVSVQMGVLVGDTTASGAVNSSDIAQTQSQSGQPVTADNFREDVTVNGAINSSDIALVQSQLGTGLPTAPSPSGSSTSPSAAPTTSAPVDTRGSKTSSTTSKTPTAVRSSQQNR
jgi:uncharacterized delta-60 repeat protein